MDLSKLTIPQLKALCKEKKLTGYSKLNKPALLAKLQDHAAANSNPASSTNASGSVQPPQTTQPALTVQVPPQPAPSRISPPPQPPASTTPAPSPTADPIVVQTPVNAKNSVSTRSALPTAAASSASTVPPVGENTANAPLKKAPKKTAKRKAETTGEADGPSKKSKKPKTGLPAPQVLERDAYTQPESRPSPVASPATATVPIPKPQPEATAVVAKSKILHPASAKRATAPLVPQASEKVSLASAPKAPLPANPEIPVLAQVLAPPPLLPPPPSARPRKAFAPLVPNKAQPTTLPHAATKQRIPGAVEGPPGDATVDEVFIDFETDCVNVPTLRTVKFPPSISQRKKVQRLSMVFSLLPVEVLAVLSKLCRLYRYSARLAASQILKRTFSGSRLDAVFKQYSPNVTDFWPYLRVRRGEVEERKRRFYQSFLGQALGSYPCLVDDRLWASDSTKHITVAVRFLLTWFYYRISIGLHVSFENLCLLNAEEVIPGEIWKITAINGSSRHYYYVLEDTCEIVGLPSISKNKISEVANPTRSRALIRADWTNYIERRLQADCVLGDMKTLGEHLSWPNHEEYDRGISRIWLRRVESEGHMGLVKLTLARRYVMACLVANSLSGRKMTAMEMEQEFNGNPALGAISGVRTKRPPHVSLFLPAHHLVESVHLHTSQKVPLHPAVASVQTPGREYFILRENGLQIGCEEEGIAEVWQKVLGCDSVGRSVQGKEYGSQ